MAELGTGNTGVTHGAIGDQERNLSSNSDLCNQYNNGVASGNSSTGGEPSFHERYPEGRERLLALAESKKCQPNSNSGIGLGRLSSPFNRHSASASSSSSPNQQSTSVAAPPTVKPKMGLKDLRNRGRNPTTANGADQFPMYSSEQSLPDKLSQAIKGGLSAAFRGGGHGSNNGGANAGNGANYHTKTGSSSGGGAVAADDVLYFSSNTNSATSGQNAGVQFRKQPNTVANSNLNKMNLSKSIEKLDHYQNDKRLKIYQNSHVDSCDFESSKILERPKNLMKIQNHASYGMNLEDLKKMYRSLPDCSTPVDDDGVDEIASSTVMTETKTANVVEIGVDGEAENGKNFRQRQNEMVTVASYRMASLKLDEAKVERPIIPVDPINPAQLSDYRYDRHAFHDHGHNQQSNPYSQQRYSMQSSTMTEAQPPHVRQDSVVSPSQDRRVRIAVPGESIEAEKRASIPSNIDFRDSCGSPTDSGYRSVPRSDDAPDQLLSTADGLQNSISIRSPCTAVSKSVFSISGNHIQQSIASDHSPSESANCNIVIIPSNGGNGNAPTYANCSASMAALISMPPLPSQQSNGAIRHEGDSSGRRVKSRPKQANGSGARMGSVPPPMTHHQNGVRQSVDDTVVVGGPNGNVPCHSPYSDLSSPSYATSTTSSSAASRASQQQLLANSMIGRPASKIGASTSNVLSQHGNGPQGVGTSFDTINTNVSLPEEFSLDRCPKLIELDRVPWNEKDVVAVLQKGRTRSLVNRIAIDVVPRLTYLLQRPLVRIARETQRLCQRFNKCTKIDIQHAAKIILPSIIGDSCQKAALQATAMFTMGGETLKQSKSQRSGLRGLSVGKFQRWMCDAQLAPCIHDQSAVYLAAVMENLLEEIVLQCMPTPSSREQDAMLTSEYLETALAHNVELWGLLQPYSHLICGRTANGILALSHATSTIVQGSTADSSNRRLSLQQQPKDCRSQHDRNSGCGFGNGTLLKNLEQCLLATCVGSTQELGELINRVLNHHLKNGSSPSLAALTNGGNVVGSTAACKQPPPVWSNDAVRTLFYFMRCSQLEHADNPHSAPPALVLAHERPYLVLPPLIEWLRVSQAHSEHRQACVVDSDDVLQAARILLPGLDCPPRPFGIEDSLPVSGRASPQTCNQRLIADLAFRMLTSGNADQVTQSIALLGVEKLDSPNDQGLTPLMWSCLKGDEMAVRLLLDAAVNVNVCVPSSAAGGKANLILPELAGWSALTFAVAHRHSALVHLLLERGAAVETPEMCTETPLQIAAMMGHHDFVNLLTSKGADPFHSTFVPDAGFKQRGCASALCLAASHGHRTVLQAMLSRRRGRSEEVLSLEDFLAEGFQSSPSSKPIGNGQLAASKSSMHLNNQQQTSAAPSPASSWLGKLTKSQQKTLQDAMYQAAECGHVDITMDLRHMGISWNTHVWTQTLAIAQDLRRKALVQLLLDDFVKHRLDDVNQEFIDDCLPLLFEIFRQSKNEVSTCQLAEIISQLYGGDPIPPIGDLLAVRQNTSPNAMAPRIDAKYVNNPDLSDIQFLIDGRIFYGHKIVLINASDRFKRLLQDGSPTVEINGLRYDVFQMMMEFLYNGKLLLENIVDLSVLSQLLCAAVEFGLRPLRVHCEALIAQCLNVENCIDIYRFALHNDAGDLARHCEGYFLQNLPTLISRVDGYRRLIMCNHAANSGLTSSTNDLNKSNSSANGVSSGAFDMADALLQTLSERLQQRLQQNNYKKI